MSKIKQFICLNNTKEALGLLAQLVENHAQYEKEIVLLHAYFSLNIKSFNQKLIDYDTYVMHSNAINKTLLELEEEVSYLE